MSPDTVAVLNPPRLSPPSPSALRRTQTALAAGILLTVATLTGATSVARTGTTVTAAISAPPAIHIETITLVNADGGDATSQAFGVSGPDLYNLSQSELVAQLSEIRALGVTDLRLGVPWLYIQPTADAYNWAQMDNVINTAHSMGFTITAAIAGTPAWDGTLLTGAPDPTAYANFAAEVAARYGSEISSYEIWNEPNGAIFYSPVSAQSYTAVLQAGYTAIKAVDPDATVLAGALGATTTVGGFTVSPQEFLTQMYASGAHGYFDALSYHPYQYTLPFSAGSGITDAPMEQLQALHAIMTANGDGNLKIWATEYGNATTPVIGVSQTVQAQFLEDFLVGWSKLAYTGPAFIHTAQDSATGALNPENNFGLFTDDGTPKLAAQMLATLIADKANGTLPDYTAPLMPVADSIYLQLASLASFVISQILHVPMSIGSAIYPQLPEPVAQVITGISDVSTEFMTAVLQATKPLIEEPINILVSLGL